MASLPLFSCLFFFFYASLCACLSFFWVHYACLCSGGHIYLAVDYFPHWAVGLIMSARPRFVSCHLINENELEGLPLYLCLLMTLFVATPRVFPPSHS